jgi:hypothetical protein
MTVSEFQSVTFVLAFTVFFLMLHIGADRAGRLKIEAHIKLSTGLQPSYPQEMWIPLDSILSLSFQIVT